MAIMGKPIFVGTLVVSLAIKPCCAVNIEHLLILIGFNAWQLCSSDPFNVNFGNLLVSFSMELRIFIFQKEILEILHRGCKLVQFANLLLRSMINTEVEPICGQGAYLISLVSLSMKNSIIKLPLRGTKRVYFGAKLRLPKQIQYC